MSEEKKKKNKEVISKSRKIVEKANIYLDWIFWIAIGFFLREVLIRWNIWKACPLISECTRCYTYGGGILG